ncbi:MAG: dehypoxanthine futalosine cyclase [Armatimonadetes bacterium]|nr:dehypoxanthine futalosine cyclase [Planctomycetota bacterium]MBI2201421.1 dehypoxanthine futalosine cyclase [Armatimonadota bacterium]
MIDDIAEKVVAGERLSFDEGMRLFRHSHLPELAALAHLVRVRKHPEPIVTYVVGRNINYTNVCWVKCKFCAFYRLPGQEGEYVLPLETVFQKIEEMLALGGIEILMQGGLNPKLKIEYYEDLFRAIRARYPQVILHALSPTEILYIAKLSRLSLEETLARLKAAGLHSIPGGGAEMLVDEVRETIAPLKDKSDEWLGVMRVAHRLGIRSTVTMMYGTVETLEQRMEHLLKVRGLQDEGHGLTAFIPWSFSPNGTPLGDELARNGTWRRATGYDYLRSVAVARLMLDNVDNLQASWVTQGTKIAQIALRYGVNDFGSTMMEENVVSAAGTRFNVQIQEIERCIRDAGYEPRRRNTRYELLPVQPPPAVTPPFPVSEAVPQGFARSRLPILRAD